MTERELCHFLIKASQQPQRACAVIMPIVQMRKRDLQCLCDLPENTQLVSGRAGISPTSNNTLIYLFPWADSVLAALQRD